MKNPTVSFLMIWRMRWKLVMFLHLWVFPLHQKCNSNTTLKSYNILKDMLLLIGYHVLYGVQSNHLSIYLSFQCPHDTPCPRDEVVTRDHPCNFEQRVPLAFSQVKHEASLIFVYQFYILLSRSERDLHSCEVN